MSQSRSRFLNRKRLAREANARTMLDLPRDSSLYTDKTTYNPGQKSLGQYCDIHIFLPFLGSLLKQCIFFEILLQFSLPPTLYKDETRKKFWIHASNIVCGVRGGVGPV